MVGCARDGGGSSRGCEEYLDLPILIVADCGPDASQWQDFDDNCKLPTYSIKVADETGNVVVDFDRLETDAFTVVLPEEAGRYIVLVTAPGYEELRAEVCLTEYNVCHITERFCDEAILVDDPSSAHKPFLLLNLTPSA